MRTFDFSPLWRSTIGFDHLADLLDNNLQQSADDNYPPYNVERCGEDAYRIALAVAGFGIDDVAVTAQRDTLIIDLVREVPDAMKPRRIPIGNAGAARQIEQKAA